MQISEAWTLVCELILATSGEQSKNIKQLKECWEYAMPPWFIAFNPHAKQRRCSRKVKVMPYSVYVEHSDMPVACFSPIGGIIDQQEKIDEATLIEALRQEIARCEAQKKKEAFFDPLPKAV